MKNRFKQENASGKTSEPERDNFLDPKKIGRLTGWLQDWLQMGLGESLLRATTDIFSVIAILAVIWLAQMYASRPADKGAPGAPQAATPTASAGALKTSSIPVDQSSAGILRQTNIHTNKPERPRQEVISYIVQSGDTIIGISQKYGLQPQTILFSNYGALLDNPDNLQPSQKLNILPVDGTYYQWQEGDGLNGVAKFFGVQPDEIVNYPGNHLDPTSVGDYSHPNIKAGTWLIVPGGTRQFVTWSAPWTTRTNPAIAQVLGPGFCSPVTGGLTGNRTFIYPVAEHRLSGFKYEPRINHFGVDFAANLGQGVYATEAGVIVYAGWNNYGYGNMIMIDHGDGFQSLYAHLSDIGVSCGESVNQGQAIGAAGNTGHSSGAHLHFEIRTLSNPINPWDVLPPP